MMIALIFFSSLTFATQKWFVVPESVTGTPVIVGSSGRPENVIAEAPLDPQGNPYPVEAIDIVDEPDPMFPEKTIKKAVLNEQKLKDKQDGDRAREQDERKKRDDKRKEKRDRKDRLKTLCAQQTGVLKELCDEVLEEG